MLILYIRDDLWYGQAVSTKKWKMHILDRFLRYYGNYVITNMNLPWGQDIRPNVDWLTQEQLKVLRDLPMSPLSRIVINLELFCGLRNVEVIRLRVKDVRICEGYLEVRGKGRGGGKWRSVPMGYGTEEAIQQWLNERNKIVSEYRKFHPEDDIPDSLLIWKRYSGHRMVINSYSERGHSLDRAVIIPLRKSVGFEFSNHTLRRTFGREMFHAGVEIETISKILGHESIDMTLKYLGLNMDDMKKGMNRAKNFFGNL